MSSSSSSVGKFLGNDYRSLGGERGGSVSMIYVSEKCVVGGRMMKASWGSEQVLSELNFALKEMELKDGSLLAILKYFELTFATIK